MSLFPHQVIGASPYGLTFASGGRPNPLTAFLDALGNQSINQLNNQASESTVDESSEHEESLFDRPVESVIEFGDTYDSADYLSDQSNNQSINQSNSLRELLQEELAEVEENTYYQSDDKPDKQSNNQATDELDVKKVLQSHSDQSNYQSINQSINQAENIQSNDPMTDKEHDAKSAVYRKSSTDQSIKLGNNQSNNLTINNVSVGSPDAKMHDALINQSINQSKTSSPLSGIKRLRISDNSTNQSNNDSVNESPSRRSRTLKSYESTVPSNKQTINQSVQPPVNQNHLESKNYGQDAYFVFSAANQPNVHSNVPSYVHAIGVCDGVGGWRAQGVDSGLIARAMVEHSLVFARLINRMIALHDQHHVSSDDPSSNRLTIKRSSSRNQSNNQLLMFHYSLPALMMAASYQTIKQSKKIRAGSTTCCILTFTSQPCAINHPDEDLVDRLIDYMMNYVLTQTLTQAVRQERTWHRFLHLSNKSLTLNNHSINQSITEPAATDLPLSGINDEDDHPNQSINQSIKEPAAEDVDLPLSGSVSEDHDSTILGTGELTLDSLQSTNQSTNQSPHPPTSTPQQSPSNNQSNNQSKSFGASLWKMLGRKSDDQSSSPSDNQSIKQSNKQAPKQSTNQSNNPPPLYLTSASLGDSGYFLLRHKRWINQSIDQTVDSNNQSTNLSINQSTYQVIQQSALQRTGRIVKQLAVIPPELSGPEHCYCDDLPDQSINQSIKLYPDDLLIVSSDGLLDNLVTISQTNDHHSAFWGKFVWAESLEQAHNQSINDSFEHRMSRRIEELVNEVYDQTIDHSINQPINQSIKQSDDLVHRLCGRLVSTASHFMNTADGKPDDLTVLVTQVNLMH